MKRVLSGHSHCCHPGRSCLGAGWSVTVSQGSGLDRLLNTSSALLKKGLYAVYLGVTLKQHKPG